MVVVALETVTRAGSMALWMDGDCHARSGDATRTHGERLPGELIDWIATHGRRLQDIDLFAVVCGPGSFTGLRVGIAAIQGFALAGQRRVVAVPTLDALANSWFFVIEPAERLLVVPCLDGQRGEVFCSVLGADGAHSAAECATLREPAASRPDELASWLTSQHDDRRIVLVGDGARRYAAVFARELSGADIVDASMTLAEAAVRMAAMHPDTAVTPHALRPVYLRRPDAVLARERVQKDVARAGPAHYLIRKAVTDDLSAVDALQRQTFSNPWGAEAIRWELENTDVARLYVMRESAGGLVAYCACWMVFDELHINSLAVDVAYRRRGVARRLLDHVLADAIQNGANSATLEVRSSNAAARRLYEQLGFRVEGVRRDYYQQPREDAVILWKRSLRGDASERKEAGA